MSATLEDAGRPTVTIPAQRKRWIDDWRPEDPTFWADTGAKVARRNLIFSIFSEHVGFAVWTLWASLVLFMGPAYGVDAAGKFLLVSMAAGVGCVARIPYTLAVAKFGGRNWTMVSAGLLLVPCILLLIFFKPGTSYTTLLLVAMTAGVGGGNFASSMANINSFFPDRLKGRALGLNAGGGNLGVAMSSLLALLVIATAGKDHPRVLVAIFIPLAVGGLIGAALFMDNLTHATNEKRAMRDALHDPHTWIMSFLYIGTFGSFIGFGFAFGQVLVTEFKADFPTPVKATYLTFLGPLLGSLIRPVGGMLSDRFTGSLVTFWNFVAMTFASGFIIMASQAGSLPLYIIGFVTLFVLTGIGNGSTYKMIPSIFWAKALRKVDEGMDQVAAERQARRLSGALIGIAGAVGASGGIFVNVAFRQSFLETKSGDAAFVGILCFYVVCSIVTWVVYRRKSSKSLVGV